MTTVNKPKPQTFFERAQTMGTKKLSAATTKAAPSKVTLLEMRANLIKRAEETVAALSNSYKAVGFRSPMAKSVRNGVSIKIGYGKRNETLIFDGATLAPRQFAHQDKYQAIEFLNEAINAIKKGEFDKSLQEMKDKYEYRFLSQNEKEKRTEDEKKRSAIEAQMNSEKSEPSKEKNGKK